MTWKQTAKQHGFVAVTAITCSAIMGVLFTRAPDVQKITLVHEGSGFTGSDTPHTHTTVKRKSYAGRTPSGTVFKGCGGDALGGGDDLQGVVHLGADALGACEIIFANELPSPATCTVSDGHVDDFDGKHMFVRGVQGSDFAYRCVK